MRRVAAGWVRGARKGAGLARSPVTVEPVHPGFDAAVLEDLGRRLSAVRLGPGGGTAWERGVPRPWLTSLLADWQQFDTGAFQARLDQLAHVRAAVGGLVIHSVLLKDLQHLDQRSPRAHATAVAPSWQLAEELAEPLAAQVSSAELALLQPSAEARHMA